MPSHILIDIYDSMGLHQRKIVEFLNLTCTQVYSSKNVQLEVYHCNGSLVYVHRRGDNLLIDIIEGESVFDKLAEHIPVHRVVIRLVERGIPAGGEQV
ncbi:MAG: hypothetical protein QW579_08050 [Desulfurococcaceae archaeon]